MKKKLIMLIGLLFSINSLIAQGQRNTWYFGHYAGITFNTIPPTYLLNAMARAVESVASISDVNGNLLFYANGWDTVLIPYSQQLQVWNKNHQVMQNSSGIHGHMSVTQGALILPSPGDSNQFYLFSIATHILSTFDGRLYYSIVDMTLDSGLGAVTQKNIVLCDSFVSEKLSAVKHANGRDWWIMAHLHNSTQFIEYLLTPAGLSGPTFFSVGPFIPSTFSTTWGQIVFSPDGSKMCMANVDGYLELFSFDRCSGTLAHTHSLGDPPYTNTTSFYGCSFSGNSNVLYASKSNALFQYNLNATNIKASIQVLYLVNVIHQPDSISLACNFSPCSFDLNGRLVKAGLPNLPNYALGPVYGSVCDTLTSVDNIQMANTKCELKAFYHTALQKLFINAEHLKGKTYTLTVTDVMGRQIFEKSGRLQPPYFSMDLDCSFFCSGLYLIALATEKEMLSQKFIK